MRRADRLFQIVQALRGGRLVTAQKLAEDLEVSQRTIYRDIADLQSTGVPVDGEAGVGYVMDAGYELPPLMFTRDEVVALVAGARMLKAFGGSGMARAAEEALVKIEAVLPQAERARAQNVGVYAESWDLPAMTRDMLDQIEIAVDARLRLRFAYETVDGAASTRTVRPLGLWFWGKVWTLIAWCELREDFRMFRVDRMHALKDLERFRAEPDKSLQAFYASAPEGTGRPERAR
ncbi:MAG: YafY family protein [Pseudomonadota bacterium]